MQNALVRSNVTRILGIDPGTLHTGWGIIERDGMRLVGLAASVIHTRDADPLEVRLRLIYDELSRVIVEWKPTEVAVEDIFFAKYPQAALKLGHARGVALLAAAHAGLSVSAYAPTLVKRTVAGRGASDKVQVAHIVSAILGWKTQEPVDATDALAVAVTHASAMLQPKSLIPAKKPARKRMR